jgi:hypothetical protein
LAATTLSRLSATSTYVNAMAVTDRELAVLLVINVVEVEDQAY